MKSVLIILLLGLTWNSALPSFAGENELVRDGNRLAAVLRAGRAVVSANQPLINDESIGDKGLTSDVFMTQLADVYRAQNNNSQITEYLSETEKSLVEAQLTAMAAIVDEQQQLINAPDLGFKGFIPAVFARLVNERFGELVGEKARVKVTAPHDLVRNRTARPDDWETTIIAEKFLSETWTKGEPWFESVLENEQTVFRMLIPEYYSASCLSCHGETKGDVDVTGFPKEGGFEGQLGGAISITLRE